MSPASVVTEEIDGTAAPTPIAVVGYDFEFPQGATSPEAFWEMLCVGRCASTKFPADRINVDAYYHPDASRNSSMTLRSGSFVTEALGAFDAPFFSITPAEAACMDPQHRRILETAYRALEDAGIPMEACSGSETSVYTGSFTDDFKSVIQADFEAEMSHAATGIAASMLANRLSWFFNFKGPSVNLDSACSSSLSALHFACQDLWNGTSSMALVGGTNYIFHPDLLRFLSNLNFLSPDGRCWSFDSRANGYARGEGCAVVVLKRLPDALATKDNIKAVIRATGMNQDGRTPGITVPNEDAQVELITNTFSKAGLSMHPARYFEAHGTGTAVGDPKEASAIGRAFADVRSKEDPLFVGAVKANIGHLEGCSGLAGLIKAILVLEKGLIPPIAGLQTLNPSLEPERWHLEFPRYTRPWPVEGLRRACVNSFGFGGTNAVAILDNASPHVARNEKSCNGVHTYDNGMPNATKANASGNSTTVETTSKMNGAPKSSLDDAAHPPDGLALSESSSYSSSNYSLMTWSAFDKDGARQLAERLTSSDSANRLSIDDALFTLSQRRTLFNWRSFAILDRRHELCQFPFICPEPTKAVEYSRVAFIFTGQGAQYQGMAAQLLDFTVFRESLHLLDETMQELGCTWRIQDFIQETSGSTCIDQPEYAQPLTTCVQIALVDLLRSFGVRPALVMGHSSGEIAAAYAAGSLSRNAALKAAFHRGRVSSQVAAKHQGLAMMAVGLSADAVRSYIERLCPSDDASEVAVACVNSPKSVTLSGRAAELEGLEEHFKRDSVFARRLRVSVAYHSKFMQTVAADYASSLGVLDAGVTDSAIPLISTVTGDIVADQTLRDPQHWVDNMTLPVKFDAGFARLLGQANHQPRKQLGKRTQEALHIATVLEIGPHSALRGPIRDILGASTSAKKPTYVPSLVRGENAAMAVLKAVGNLHCAGVAVDVAAVNNLTERPTSRAFNMPRYPFNHGHIHWEESLRSKNVRFPKNARNDLLGSLMPDANPQSPQWRNVIRMQHLPWLEDHKVQGDAVYPASATLLTAVEAFKQTYDDDAALQGCEMRDVAFTRAITFASGTDKIETRLSLTLPSSDADRCIAWSYFKVYTVDADDTFSECCSGAIRGCSNSAAQGTHYPLPTLTGVGSLSEWVSDTESACTEDFNVQAVYDAATTDQVQYGPSFQVLDGLRLGNGSWASADIKTGQWRLSGSSQSTALPPIHPTSLDGMLQLLVGALTQKRKYAPAMMPSRLANVYIDCRHTDILNDGRIRSMARTWPKGYRRVEADIVALKPDSSVPLVWLQGLEATYLGGAQGGLQPSRATDPDLCMSLSWKPDIAAMSNAQLEAACTRERPDGPRDAVASFKSMSLAAMTFVMEAMNAVRAREVDQSLPAHLSSYISWMAYQLKRLRDQDFLFPESEVKRLLEAPEERQKLLQEVEDINNEGRAIVTMGRNLIPILRKQSDPLGLLFSDGLADKLYEVTLGNAFHSHPSRAFVDLLSFKNPSLKVLEVGAGTGGQTLECLKAMSPHGIKRFAQYDYTDISAGFFSEAREKFAEFEHLMNFKTFNAEKDPIDQGFEAGTYDLLVASHVIHATASIEGSLQNMRKLLKPGGKLLLFETTRPEYLLTGFVFGLLWGWWMPLTHEERTELSPCVPTKTWNDLLCKSGFLGVDIEFLGQQQDVCQYSSTIVATADGPPHNANPSGEPVDIVIDKDSSFQTELAQCLEQRLGLCTTYSLPEFAQIQGPRPGPTLFLVEVNSSLLFQMSQTEYDNLHSILQAKRNSLWITRSASSEPDPRHHVVEGMARSLASEDSSRKFTTLELEPQCLNTDAVSLIVHIVELQMSQISDLESHTIVRDGVPHISRITENPGINHMIAQRALSHRLEEVVADGNVPLVLRTEVPGSLQTLRFCLDEAFTTDVEDDEVIVKVGAINLTRRDYMSASGQLDEMNLGSGCAGTVQSAGRTSALQRGDRVVALGASTCHTLHKTSSSAVAVMPKSLNLLDAAALSNAAWAAYHGLFELGRIEEGDTVLILESAGSVGHMAVQMAKKVGAKVLRGGGLIDPVSKTNLSVDDSCILSGVDRFLRSEVHEKTKAKGVDILMGSLRSGMISDYAQCLAPFGRLIDTREKVLARSAFTATMPPNTAYASINLADFARSNARSAHRSFQKSMRYAFENAISTSGPVQVYQPREVEHALRHFEKTDAEDPVVVKLEHGDAISASVPNTSRCQLAQDGTYVIAGGLGGLGRSFARWMVERGARHLVLLSRRGAVTPPSQKLVSELREKGVTVATPACDITQLDVLVSKLEEVSSSMPPIKGCIQATVVLRDATFDNMSYEDWKIGLDSKAVGTWNLHTALPTQLDFFVIIASLNGILGGGGQANYAAGNTFKDAVAHHRVAHGEKAVSIDLGLMVAEGIVAEDEAMLASLRRVGVLKDIAQADLLALLDHYCDPTLPLLDQADVQVLVGAELPSAALAKGADLPPAYLRPMARHLFRMGSHSEQRGSANGVAAVDRQSMLRDAASTEEAEQLAVSWFAAKVSYVLGVDEADIDASRPVHTYGVDSLTAIDLKNWLRKDLGADIPVVQLLGSMSLADVGGAAVAKSSFRAS